MVFDYVKDIIIVKCAIELSFLVLYFLLCWCLDSSTSPRKRKHQPRSDFYSQLDRSPLYFNDQISAAYDYDAPSSPNNSFHTNMGQHFCNQSQPCQAKSLIQTTKSVYPCKNSSRFCCHFENSTWVNSTSPGADEKEPVRAKNFNNCL